MSKRKIITAMLAVTFIMTSITTTYVAALDAVAATLTMDTRYYVMPPNGIYDFKATVLGDILKQEDVKVKSSRDGIAKVERIAGTDKYRITALTPGDTYIISEIKGAHASIKVTVQKGATPHGSAERSITTIKESDLSDTVNVTFPEGINLLEVADLLEKNKVCSAAEVLNVAKSGNFNDNKLISAISNRTLRPYQLEGYLFPDTYNFYKNTTAEKALKRMLDTMEIKMTEQIKGQTLASGKTMDQVITLASLIQAEAANKNDMYLVSSVLHNRLMDGSTHGTPMLQCDSTVWYPYKNRAAVPDELVNTFTSLYNTYNFAGLPAGPICNPGLEAIDAALNPSKTSYYYFCHSKAGTPYYAATLEEHENNLVLAGLK